MSLSLSLQGRDELGNLAGGPSEESHEQYTNYEGADAASARHGGPGVTHRAPSATTGQSDHWTHKDNR